MDTALDKKYANLRKIISKLGSVVVAYSGGVDSALVLKVAHEGLGERAVGVIADSPSLPRSELAHAKRIAESIGAKLVVVKTEELDNENYLKNPANRCYYCKTELYSKLRPIAAELGIKNLLNGTNLDDMSDYRPGMQAAIENSVISPLKDAELTKANVRQLAKQLGLEVWDKPSSPCLSSRVPYGNRITVENLLMIEQGEDFLKGLGIMQLRVRHFGKTAKVEVTEEDKQTINKNFETIKERFRQIGFEDVLIANFKSGSLNVIMDVQR